MQHGKRYLIFGQDNNLHTYYKMAYWFDERNRNCLTFKPGFYVTEYRYYPCENVIGCLGLEEIDLIRKSKTTLEIPTEGYLYCVYRNCDVHNQRKYMKSHYTVRKYHNDYFGSDDVIWWIDLVKLLKENFKSIKWSGGEFNGSSK